MIQKSKTDIVSQDVSEASQQAFAKLFQLILESDSLKKESNEDYKVND